MGATDQCHIFVRLRPQRRSASTLKTKDRHHTTSRALCQADRRKISANFVPSGIYHLSPIPRGALLPISRVGWRNLAGDIRGQAFERFRRAHPEFGHGFQREIVVTMLAFADFRDSRDYRPGDLPASSSNPHASACRCDGLRGLTAHATDPADA
ncbi:hypothetical protein [Burkholderia sp. Ac-20344]|uniref:hypothetical protein n=1 Tax=Burkholderia sp. Ac-20344 TaxID=2703890 RepID=UPI00197B7660|nr:hypothetical protein [Burkholderia sp. Ac-20344]MBN3832162.1 hypothetical protein [Burkholderia sp. Ac-20344]